MSRGEQAGRNGQTRGSGKEKGGFGISSSKTLIEIDGESYVVFEESIKTFGEDGITVVGKEFIESLSSKTKEDKETHER